MVYLQIHGIVVVSGLQTAGMHQLAAYARTTWMTGCTFIPAEWCVYKSDVQTNNDMEWWHQRLNHKGKRGNKLRYSIYCNYNMPHHLSAFIFIR